MSCPEFAIHRKSCAKIFCNQNQEHKNQIEGRILGKVHFASVTQNNNPPFPSFAGSTLCA